MALRMIEMQLAAERLPEVENLLHDHPVLDVTSLPATGGKLLVRVLLEAQHTEPVLDSLAKRFSGATGTRIILLPVEASIPRPEPEPAQPPATAQPEPKNGNSSRISREELWADIADSSRLSTVYIVTVVLSSIVAAVGLLKDNVAVIIGAMVIAPLLGPNVALSLATTLGDTPLFRRATRQLVAGIGVALVVSVALGILIPVDPHISEIASRTRVDLSDIVLALAAGTAGALAFTTGVPAVLIGVMVAVALLPPLVTTGMLAGSGQYGLALEALLLFASNLICVNLAGVVTFLVQGIHPRAWWEADRAKKAVRTAMVLWTLLLLSLCLVILATRKLAHM